MENDVDDFVHFNFDFEFFKNFPPQAVAWILIVFEFATGKFPLQTAMGIGWALCDEQSAVLFDQPGRYEDHKRSLNLEARP